MLKTLTAPVNPRWRPGALVKAVDYEFLAAHEAFVRVVHEGSSPVASALTKEVENRKLYERQEIVDPIFCSPVSARSQTPGRYRVARARIPEQQWVEVYKRYCEGESLRQLAASFGVSHEAVRQIVNKVKVF